MGPYRLLEEALKALHKEAELLERVEKLHAADPENVPLGYFLAEKLFDAGNHTKAEPLFRGLLVKAPTAVGYRSLIAIERKANRYDALVGLLGEAVSKTGSLGPLSAKEPGLSGDADMVREVLEAARRRLNSQPASVTFESLLALAWLARDAKQFDAATEFHQRAAQAKPEQAAEILTSWGLDLLAAGEHSRAVRALTEAVNGQKSSNSAQLHLYLAGALEMDGQTENALAAARRALSLARAEEKGKPAAKELAQKPAAPQRKGRPDRKKPEAMRPSPLVPRCLARIAWIYYRSKRPEEATKTYGELIEKYGADYRGGEIRQLVREARLALSNLAVLQGRNPEAVECLELVLDEFPDDVSALNDLGYLWAEQGRHLQRAGA